jgi:hypothetical protein
VAGDSHKASQENDGSSRRIAESVLLGSRPSKPALADRSSILNVVAIVNGIARHAHARSGCSGLAGVAGARRRNGSAVAATEGICVRRGSSEPALEAGQLFHYGAAGAGGDQGAANSSPCFLSAEPSPKRRGAFR